MNYPQGDQRTRQRSRPASHGAARWLVTGAAGMLGSDLTDLLNARLDDPATQLDALPRTRLDITDRDAVKAAVASFDIVVNAAAWIDVDGAESQEAAAARVNGAGVRNLAEACASSGALLLHVSTDYVFPGDASAPIPEDAPTAALNAYGRGKLIGERAVAELLPDSGYVVRTAWLYGAHGGNFVRTILNAAKQREFLDAVDDQRGQPTWTRALAEQLIALGHSALAGSAPSGFYHGTCAGETTWFGLARAAFELTGLDPDRIRPTTTAQFPRPAPRPKYSVLGHGRWAGAGLDPMPAWRECLARYLSGQ